MPSDFDLNVPYDAHEDECMVIEISDEDPAHHHQPQSTQGPDTEKHQHHTADREQLTNHHKARLSTEDKLGIVAWLLERKVGGVLPHGSITAAAQEFNLSRKTISTLWHTAQKNKTSTGRYECRTKFHLCGRKRIQVQQDDISNLTIGVRSCIRDLAEKLNISASTIWRMIKRGLIKPHTNALHPGLKDPNKIARLQWVLSLLMGETWEDKEKYVPMYDFVHLDEKWFYLTRKSQRVYLAKNERGKYRAAKSSKFIPKVMFTAVVARPRFNQEGECTFDGKIGIFPFTYSKPAQRSSRNRKRGTLVTKIIESVNKKVTRDTLINQTIPAIKAKWPADGPKVIFIQQDNARTHITQDDREWQKVYQQDGFTFILIQQPPNSPDLNILDLGVFRSIQSLMHKKMPKDVDEMLDAVNEAFYELEPTTLDNVWLTLQYVMNEILKAKGANDFDLPHVNKSKLEAQGLLQRQVKAPQWAIKECWDIVQTAYVQAYQTDAEEWEDEMNTGQHSVEDINLFGEGTLNPFDHQPIAMPFGEGTSNHGY